MLPYLLLLISTVKSCGCASQSCCPEGPGQLGLSGVLSGPVPGLLLFRAVGDSVPCSHLSPKHPCRLLHIHRALERNGSFSFCLQPHSAKGSVRCPSSGLGQGPGIGTSYSPNPVPCEAHTSLCFFVWEKQKIDVEDLPYYSVRHAQTC